MIALSLLVALAAAGADAAPAAKESGELWEVTSKMSMEGMPMEMPANTQKVCSPKTWTEPPGGNADKNCETLDFKSSGNSTTWKVRCAGPPAMTGEGQITRTSPDAYTGTMKISSPQGDMTMKLNGRRIGDCDRAASQRDMAERRSKIEAQAAAMQQQAAAGQQQAAAAQATMCKSSVDRMDLRMMEAMASMCSGTPVKELFCARLATPEGFQMVCNEQSESGTSLAQAAAYCGKNAEGLRTATCEEALNGPSLDLLGRCCPAQTRELAQKECAGRKYTAMTGSKYQSFCVKYAGDALAGGH